MTISGTDFLAPDLPTLLTSTPATRPRRRVFPGDPAQVAHARRFVQRTLAPHGPAADAALLTSELATNAIRHTATGQGGTFEIIICQRPATVRIAVIDAGSPTIPAPLPPGDLASSGRGLALVDALARQWGQHGRDCNFNGVTPETEETPVTDVTIGQGQDGPELSAADEQLLRELTERARTGGLKLTGQGGLLGKLTKMVVEGALEGEMDDHLGYGKHDPAGRDGGNSRNGRRAKTVLTDTGPVQITVPRDRESSFEPKIVAKRQRRLTGVDEMVISLSAKGLTHGEIAAHLAEVYGAEVSKQTITTITDRVMEGMAEWQSRPLDPVYAVIFIDAINVKIREGQVANRPVYLALGVTVDGERDVLGLWAGEHGDGEGAKFWLRILAEIKNRGVRDVCMLVCDGLKGLPDAVNTVWEKTIVQTCIVHLLRNSFKYASKRDWAQIAKDLKPVYTAASEADALDRFAEFSGKWEKRYPAIIRLWENAWAEFVPFLAFDREIRTVICTTNAIESINARLRRAVNARGHFPTEQAALKCLYMAIMSLDPTGKGRKRWTNRWKAALNAFDITFDGRLSAGRK